MTVYEIVGGVILLVVAVAIIVLTLLQHTHGQGSARRIRCWPKSPGSPA